MPFPSKTISLIALSIGTVLGSTPAVAQVPPGRMLASQCAQCHGTNGQGPGFEELAGKSANDLYGDLREMKLRPVEGIMDRQARGYTDQQLRLIADYLSTVTPSGNAD
ncbi:MAG: cytochrome C [Propionivibrio sp.]|uniref:c-type cytochrome n=1 Tax=Propionivibrio sp. TaxID=2212460 RepID=UPI001A4CD977|nr:c-type cytochrome [Propionivibrio sp.]MBL8416587.1 cytochrome C [Propionivibrio sp.]